MQQNHISYREWKESVAAKAALYFPSISTSQYNTATLLDIISTNENNQQHLTNDQLLLLAHAEDFGIPLPSSIKDINWNSLIIAIDEKIFRENYAYLIAEAKECGVEYRYPMNAIELEQEIEDVYNEAIRESRWLNTYYHVTRL